MGSKAEIEALAKDLMELKDFEAQYKALRIKREEELARAIATKDEGTDKLQAGAYRITVTSKLTRELDYEAYLAIESSLPEGIKCVDLKPSLDLKKLRAMDMVRPGFSAQFITTKPAKAAVKVELVEA